MQNDRGSYRGLSQLDPLAHAVLQQAEVGGVQTLEDAFPAVGEAAAFVATLVLEERVEGAAALAVLVLDLRETLGKGIEIGGGKGIGVGHQGGTLGHRRTVS